MLKTLALVINGIISLYIHKNLSWEARNIQWEPDPHSSETCNKKRNKMISSFVKNCIDDLILWERPLSCYGCIHVYFLHPIPPITLICIINIIGHSFSRTTLEPLWVLLIFIFLYFDFMHLIFSLFVTHNNVL